MPASPPAGSLYGAELQFFGHESVGTAVARQGRVAPSCIPGQFSTEPGRWRERIGGRFRVELDLDDDQPIEASAVDVDVGFRAVDVDGVADLLDPPALRVGPQLLSIVGRDVDFDLRAAATASDLDRQLGRVVGDPDSNFCVAVLGDVPLPNRDA